MPLSLSSSLSSSPGCEIPMQAGKGYGFSVYDPETPGGLPVIGRLPGVENAFIASGAPGQWSSWFSSYSRCARTRSLPRAASRFLAAWRLRSFRPWECTRGSENRRSRSSLSHDGHAGVISPRTSSSNGWPHPLQEYS